MGLINFYINIGIHMDKMNHIICNISQIKFKEEKNKEKIIIHCFISLERKRALCAVEIFIGDNQVCL
jgi:hypothetical protein